MGKLLPFYRQFGIMIHLNEFVWGDYMVKAYKVFPVLGGIGAILLLGSFFVGDTPRDIMRLLGFILLLVFCIFKLTRSSKGNNSK